jgi:hypothetical protein
VDLNNAASRGATATLLVTSMDPGCALLPGRVQVIEGNETVSSLTIQTSGQSNVLRIQFGWQLT